jgi:hypothetical protein
VPSVVAKYWSLLANAVRYDGVAVLSWRVLRQLVSPLGSLEAHVLIEYDLRGTLPPVETAPEITIRLASADEMEAVVGIEFGPEEPAGELRAVDSAGIARLADVQRERMSHGDFCVVAVAGSDIVHFSWVRVGALPPVLARPVVLPQGECYLTDGYTVRRWRGKRLFDAVSIWALVEAQRRGAHHAYAMADFIKAPSRRMTRRIGFTRRGRVIVFRWRHRDRGFVIRLSGRADPFFRTLW